MIPGDECGLNFLRCLTVEGKSPKKYQPGKWPERGLNLGPLMRGNDVIPTSQRRSQLFYKSYVGSICWDRAFHKLIENLVSLAFLRFIHGRLARWIKWAELILQPFRHFTYVTTHSPTLPSLYLRHSSFSNPSVASSTSRFILQPFFRFSYVTSSSLNSPGEPSMVSKDNKSENSP